MEKYQSLQVQSDVTISGILETHSDCSDTCIFTKYKSGICVPSLPFRLYGQDDEINESFENGKIFERPMSRGPYKKYTQEQKLSAIEEINKGYDVKYVSKKYDIPRRNLLRWRKNGCIRKQGGGRPTDTEMEMILCEKIKNFELQDEMDIRLEALKLSRVDGFKGSKSWYMKFVKRHRLFKKNIEY